MRRRDALFAICENKMGLNDLWRNIKQEIGFFTIENFEKIPQKPGVYAWFYPLRLITRDYKEFINEVKLVFDFDPVPGNDRWKNFSSEYFWSSITVKAKVEFGCIDISEQFLDIWNKLVNDENSFKDFQKILMKSTIFLPPLYVGKTGNLYTRAYQHINGTFRKSDFHNRFENYAAINSLNQKKIKDLLFVAVITENEKLGNKEKIEDLVEDILKKLCKPIYSQR